MNMLDDNNEHTLVYEALDAQHGFQCVIDDFSGDLFLPDDKAIELQQHVIDVLAKYSALCHIAQERRDLLWNMTPKFHWLYHLGQRSHFLCPRRGACWIDEDYVNKCKCVAQACSAGTPLHLIPPKIVEIVLGLEVMHANLDS